MYGLIAVVLMLIAGPAAGATFSDTHPFNWSPGDTLSGALPPGDEVPAQFYADLAGAFFGTSSYDDSVPLLGFQCLNPVDGTDCYGLFGGAAGVDVSLSITIDGTTFTGGDFSPTVFVAVIPDGKFFFDAENPGQGLPPSVFDIVAISTEVSSGPILNGRWQIQQATIFASFPADTLADPFGNDLTGIDLYNLGTARELSLLVFDMQTGETNYAIARNPEPTTALLLGAGLAGLAASGRRGARPQTKGPTHGNPS